MVVKYAPGGATPADIQDALERYRPSIVVSTEPLTGPFAAAVRARRRPSVVVSTAPISGAAQIARSLPPRAIAVRPPTAAQQASFDRCAAAAHADFGDDDAAEQWVIRSLSLAPKDSASLELLFRIEVRWARFWLALGAAERRVALSGFTSAQKARAFFDRAQVRELIGDVPGAQSDLEQVLKLEPREADAEGRLARLLRDTPPQALRYAEQSARDTSSPRRRAEQEALVGAILIDLGKRTEARTHLLRALSLDAGNTAALEGMVEITRDLPAEAAAYVDRAASVADAAPLWERPASYRLCARLSQEAGDDSKAVLLLGRALRLDPEDLYTLEALVRIRRERPHEPLAPALQASAAAAPAVRAWSERQLAEILTTDPDDLEALGRMIDLQRRRGRLPEAVDFAEKFMDALPRAPLWRQPVGYRFITESWLALGKISNASKSLDIAKDLDRRSLEIESLTRAIGRQDYGFRAAGDLSNQEGAYVAIAQARAELGDAAGARANLSRALALIPDDPAALEAAANLALDEGRFQDARTFADRLVAASSGKPAEDQVEALRLLARAQLKMKDVSEAENSLERAQSLLPEDESVLNLLIGLSASRPRQALAYANRLVAALEDAAPNRLAGAYDQLALIQSQLKDYPSSERSLRRALALAPDAPEVLKTLTLVERDEGNPRAALEAAERLVAISSDSTPAQQAEALLLRSRIEFEQKDAAAGTENLRRALALVPDDPSALTAMARLDLDAGRPRDARTHAERLVAARAHATPEDRAEALLLLARIQLALKDGAGAETSLRQVLSLQPDDDAALNLLIQLDRAAGRTRKALRLADRVITSAAHRSPPIRAAAYRQRAEIRLERGDEAGARDDDRSALSVLPDDMNSLWALVATGRDDPADDMRLLKEHRPSAKSLEVPWLIMRATVRTRRAQSDLAQRDFERAVKIDSQTACMGPPFEQYRDLLVPAFFDVCVTAFPRDSSLFCDRGVARAKQGRRDEALADFRKAVALKPDNLEARLSLASILSESGRRDEALAETSNAVQACGGRMDALCAQLLDLRKTLLAAPNAAQAKTPTPAVRR